METNFPLDFACAALYGLRRHADKYIYAPQAEYYDLSRDRREMENLYDAGSTTIQFMRDAALAVRGQADPDRPATPALSAEEKLALIAMGYTGERGAEREGLPDPKDFIHVINKMSEVLHLKETGRLEEALALVEQVAEQSEGWEIPVHCQANLLEILGRLRPAADLLRSHATRFPNDRTYFELAKKLFLLKQFQECLQVLDHGVFNSGHETGLARMLAGDCLVELGRPKEARSAYERAREIDADQLGDALIERIDRTRQLLP